MVEILVFASSSVWNMITTVIITITFGLAGNLILHGIGAGFTQGKKDGK